MEGHGRSWKVMEGHGRSWKVMEGHGRSWRGRWCSLGGGDAADPALRRQIVRNADAIRRCAARSLGIQTLDAPQERRQSRRRLGAVHARSPAEPGAVGVAEAAGDLAARAEDGGERGGPGEGEGQVVEAQLPRRVARLDPAPEMRGRRRLAEGSMEGRGRSVDGSAEGSMEGRGRFEWIQHHSVASP